MVEVGAVFPLNNGFFQSEVHTFALDITNPAYVGVNRRNAGGTAHALDAVRRLHRHMTRSWLYAVSKKVDVKRERGQDVLTKDPIREFYMGTIGPIQAGLIRLFHRVILPSDTIQIHR